jgi:hypothetical protein
MPVGTRSQQVHRRQGIGRVAGQVHPSPQPLRDAVPEQRRRLDGHQQVERDDTPGHRRRRPRGRTGHEQVGESERDPRVEDQADQVDHDEHDREPSEEPVHVEQPGCGRATSESSRGEGDAPQHRGHGQHPGDDPRRARHIPPHLRGGEDYDRCPAHRTGPGATAGAPPTRNGSRCPATPTRPSSWTSRPDIPALSNRAGARAGPAISAALA